MVKGAPMSSVSRTAILRYMCSICSTLIRKINVDGHVRIHTSTSNCELCNFTDSNHDKLMGHIKSHLKKWFECPTCGDIYVSEQSYLEHKVTHSGSLFVQKVHYECCECAETYFPVGRSHKSLKKAMQKHQARHGSTSSWDAQPLDNTCDVVGRLSEDEWSIVDDVTDGNKDRSNDRTGDSLRAEPMKTTNLRKQKIWSGHNVKCSQTTNIKQKYTSIVNNISSSFNESKVSPKRTKNCCHICQESFTRKLNLTKHLKTKHTDAVQNKCEQCSKSFTSTNRLNVHISQSHKASTPSMLKLKSIEHGCVVCKATFTLKGDLTTHEKTVHAELKTNHHCEHCSRPSFKTRNYLRAHMKRVHGIELEELNNFASSETEVVKNAPKEDTRDDLKPSGINTEAASNEDVDMGSKEHTEIDVRDIRNGCKENSDTEKVEIGQDKKPQTSDQTSDIEDGDGASKRITPNKASNSKHTNGNTYSKYHLCGFCQKKYSSKSGLLYHIAANHTKRQTDFECAACKQHFCTKRKLKAHMNDNGCHACEVCGQRFRQNYNLVLHRSIHTGEKPFQCYQCGKTFRVKSYLEDHLRVHRGEKQFVCLQCEMKFMTVGALRRHSRTHTQERPFMCSYCGKGFKLHPNLNRHMRIHSGERYDCPICHRKITEKSNLAKHMRIHEKRGKMVLKAAPKSIVIEGQKQFPESIKAVEQDKLSTVKPALLMEQGETVSISVHLSEHSEPLVLTIPVRSSP